MNFLRLCLWKIVVTFFGNKLINAKSALGTKRFFDSTIFSSVAFCLLWHFIEIDGESAAVSLVNSSIREKVQFHCTDDRRAPPPIPNKQQKSNFISNENTKMSSAGNSNSDDRKTQFARFSHIRFFAVHPRDEIA